MGWIGKCGSVLRVMSLFWCASSVVRILIALGKNDTIGMRVHLILLAAGGVLFTLATFRRNRWGKHGVQSIATSVTARWWQASLVFRACALLSAAWAVIAYLWQDGYRRDITLVFGPSLGLLAAYWAFKVVVVGPKQGTTIQPEPQLQPVPRASESSALPEVQRERTPIERERAMQELVQRMTAKQ